MMSRFTRGDLVVVMRTAQGHCAAKGRVIDYDVEARSYSVSIIGEPGRVLLVEAKDLVASRGEAPRGEADLSRGEPFEAFGEIDND